MALHEDEEEDVGKRAENRSENAFVLNIAVSSPAEDN